MSERDLRLTFDTVAELYERARPTYPPEIFDDVVALSGVPDGGRVLEIGCGTGQATRPMAERGYRITAVELGPNLADIARRNLAAYPHVEVQTGAFEEWPLPEAPFDLVMSVTAFHWLNHDVALPKIFASLRPGGALAVVGGGHVAGGDTEFFHEAQACYQRFMPGTPPGLPLQEPDDVPPQASGIESSGLFQGTQIRRHIWLREFTMQGYIDELSTYSNHIALSDENRQGLLACIANMIDVRYGGRITKAYLSEVAVGFKRRT